MRIVYLGTPDFSVLPLKKIVDFGYEVVAVVTNLDKPVGRKQILTPPPVKEYAVSNGIKVFQYKKIRVEGVEDLKALKPDIMITCAFGQILSQEILDIPKLGVFNIHASLLPKYRGASPINYAILNGEKETGVTIMKTDAGIDTGDILFSEKVEIKEDETAGELFDKLSILGAEMIIKALKQIEKGDFVLTKQAEADATYTKMIKKEDALIDFNDSAENVVNKIRAFNPSPVAYTFLFNEPLKIYSAKVVDKKGNVGEVIENKDELIIACKNKAVSITSLQKAGGKRLNITDFLRGNKLELGYKFTNA